MKVWLDFKSIDVSSYNSLHSCKIIQISLLLISFEYTHFIQTAISFNTLLKLKINRHHSKQGTVASTGEVFCEDALETVGSTHLHPDDL